MEISRARLRKAILLFFAVLFISTGCFNKKFFSVDITIDLSPIPRDLYNSAVLQISPYEKGKIISIPLSIEKNVGILKNITLTKGIYTLTVSLFSNDKLVGRYPINEGLFVEDYYLQSSIYTLSIDQGDKKLLPVINSDVFGVIGKPIVLDGRLSRGNGDFSAKWGIHKKPAQSKLANDLGDGLVAEVIVDYPGRYEFALVLEDGASREVAYFTVEVADEWILFNEPVTAIEAGKDSSLIVLSGYESKLSVIKDSGIRDLFIGGLPKGLAVNANRSMAVVWTYTGAFVVDLDELNVIAKYTGENMISASTISDEGVAYFFVPYENKLVSWNKDDGFQETLMPYCPSLSKLGIIGKDLFGVASTIIKLPYKRTDENLGKTVLAYSNDFLIDNSARLYRVLPELRFIPICRLNYNLRFSQGAIYNDLAALIMDIQEEPYNSAVYLEVYDLAVNASLKRVRIPTFGGQIQINGLTITTDYRVAVALELINNASIQESIISIYKICLDGGE